MNKKEIKNRIKEAKEQITELQKTVNNLEEQLNKPDGRWKPERNENYYYIQQDGYIGLTNNLYDIDQRTIAIGNCFQTQKEAEFEVERLKVITELKEFAFEPDWEDNNQGKYVLAYDHIEKKITYCILMWIQRDNDNLYFETKEFMEKAIEKVGENRIKKYLFGIEE